MFKKLPVTVFSGYIGSKTHESLVVMQNDLPSKEEVASGKESWVHFVDPCAH